MAGKRPQRRYTREALLNSRRYAGWQQDFLRAVLHKETYTIPEAERALREFFMMRGE